jgi:Flp pilus assembly protein TadD
MRAARKQFEILSAEAPHNTDLLFSLALINHELEDNIAAKAYLNQVVALGTREDEAYLFLGQIARSEGDIDEAVVLFQQVGDGDDLLKATMNIAQIQMAANREQAFADYMNRLRESYPPRAEQLFALEANVYRQSDNDERGLEVLTRAIDEYPESDNLRYARSVLHERANDIPAAEADLRSIIERDPDNSAALNALGYTLANRTDRLDEAQALIEKALSLSPKEPAILDSMGWVLYRQGDLKNAAEFLTRAYAGFPDGEVAAHLGEVLWVAGNRNGALTVLRGALQKDPQHILLNETLNRLGISLQADAES